MRHLTLLLWAAVSAGSWQFGWAQQPSWSEEPWTQAFSDSLDQAAWLARQWWETLQSQAGAWSAQLQQSLAQEPALPQQLPGSPPVARQATGPQQVPLPLSQQPAPGQLCPHLPDEQPLLPQGASSLGELQGWFQAVDDALDRAAAEATTGGEPKAACLPLVAPPASVAASTEAHQDHLVLEEESGCGCFDSSVESLPLADLVRDLRHSAGDQLALQLNEESDGLHDPPVATLPAPQEETSNLAVTAPWLEECDDFCHMDALGPSQVEITSRPPYASTCGNAMRAAGEELLRRSSLALERIARGFHEAWQILRGEMTRDEASPQPALPENIPHNARRIQEGDIGL